MIEERQTFLFCCDNNSAYYYYLPWTVYICSIVTNIESCDWESKLWSLCCKVLYGCSRWTMRKVPFQLCEYSWAGKKYGEDALVEYCYGMILTRLPESKEEMRCLVSHLIDFYQQKLIETPSKQKYIQKMLYMLNSIQEPFDIETLR